MTGGEGGSSNRLVLAKVARRVRGMLGLRRSSTCCKGGHP